MEQCERCHGVGWRRISRLKVRVYCQCPKGRELLKLENEKLAKKRELATQSANKFAKSTP